MSSTEVVSPAAPVAPRSKWATFYRSVLFQMILFGALSFVGPAMADALSNLGGGGLSKPWLANIANCLSYAMSFAVTLFGGPLINKIGIKWSCFIAAVAMPIRSSSFYVNARYKSDWYLLLGNIINGITAGFLYVGESTAMLSYPEPEKRGLYLGIWSAMRSSGSLLGGAINFSNNHGTALAGGVAWSTYIIFVCFGCTGVIWALLLSPTQKVRRSDGSRVSMPEKQSWKEELVFLWRTMHEKKILAVFLPSFYSFFYGATMGTYLSLHFSVRARALSSLLVPALTIVSVLAYGKLLDGSWASLKRRAWICSLLWIIPTAGAFVWIVIEYQVLGEKAALDYGLDAGTWLRAYVPYLIIFVIGYWTQLSLYWILGNFSFEVGSTARTGGLFRAFETAGQAVAYGISSSASTGGAIPFYINCALFVLVLPCIWWLIHLMPEVPVTEGIEAAARLAKDVEDGKVEDVNAKKV